MRFSLRGDGAEPMVVDIKMMEEHHGYSDTDNILYAVYNHRRSPVCPVDHDVYTIPGSGKYAVLSILHVRKS